MSDPHLNSVTDTDKEREVNKPQLDANLNGESNKHEDEGATLTNSNSNKEIVLDTTSEKVEALEQELSERKKQIVTSFQLQELNHSARTRRRSSVKSSVVLWSRAEEQ